MHVTAKTVVSFFVCKMKEPYGLCPLTYGLVSVNSIYEYYILFIFRFNDKEGAKLSVPVGSNFKIICPQANNSSPEYYVIYWVSILLFIKFSSFLIIIVTLIF